MSNVYGKIVVAHRDPRYAAHPHQMTFSDRRAFDEALRTLKRNGATIVDEFWGYRIYDKAEDALADYAIFNS